MDYRPNVDAMLWFGLNVLPRVRRQLDVRLQIVGMNPHPRLNSLRALPDVELTGAVEDIVPYIRGASVYLTPMRVGGGTRFKVLEALACARPLVSTTLGVEGIPVRGGEHVLIADDARSFADAVVSLLRDQAAGGARSRALGEAARSFVEKQFTWDKILPQMDAFHAQLAKE
jgi:glycosyltransferase involved in cell wall biosynthesis